MNLPDMKRLELMIYKPVFVKVMDARLYPLERLSDGVFAARGVT